MIDDVPIPAGVEVVERDLGGRRGAWQRDRLGDLVVLDRSLDLIARRAVLVHELVHAERGIGWGAATAATMEREEEIVRVETARRLVPPGDLAAFLSNDLAESAAGGDVERAAAHFAVPIEVAAVALDSLRRVHRPG